jgi:hypothetical protein
MTPAERLSYRLREHGTYTTRISPDIAQALIDTAPAQSVVWRDVEALLPRFLAYTDSTYQLALNRDGTVSEGLLALHAVALSNRSVEFRVRRAAGWGKVFPEHCPDTYGDDR